MDEHIRVRRGRKFPPRIPKEELNERVSHRLSACGVQNNLQSQYEAEAARLAQTLTDPRFESLKADLKLSRKSKAWKTAFSVIFAYLDEFSMRATHDTIHVEAQNKDFPEDESAFDVSHASDYLSDLVNLALSFNDHDDRFAEAVKDFSISPTGQRSLSASPKQARSPPKPQPQEEVVESQYEYPDDDGDPPPVVKEPSKLQDSLGSSDSDPFGSRFSDLDNQKLEDVAVEKGKGEEEDNVSGDFDIMDEDFDS
jgi:hypothetical protein